MDYPRQATELVMVRISGRWDPALESSAPKYRAPDHFTTGRLASPPAECRLADAEHQRRPRNTPRSGTPGFCLGTYPRTTRVLPRRFRPSGSLTTISTS